MSQVEPETLAHPAATTLATLGKSRGPPACGRAN